MIEGTSRMKAVLSVAIVIVAGIATVFIGMPHTDASYDTGLIIDFGDRETVWTGMAFDDGDDAFSALEDACERNGFELVTDGLEVLSIDGRPPVGTEDSWCVWTIAKGSVEWKRQTVSPDNVDPSAYTVTAWALGSSRDIPAVAVDSTGVCFYTYTGVARTVSLAPSVTETVCSVGVGGTIVGTDYYSNYPDYIQERRDSGLITNIGGYTNPSFEYIVSTNPDMVFCSGDQNSHIEMASKLRMSGMNAVVLYNGQDVDTILDNMFMCAVAAGVYENGMESIKKVTDGIAGVVKILDDHTSTEFVSTMMALSTAKSPWVSGSYTYLNDVTVTVKGTNVYSPENGWVQVSSETIPSRNPSLIIIVSSAYECSESGYLQMLSELSAEWRNTDAYRTGNIYILSGGAEDLASRAAPRIAQMTELAAKILHPDAFEGFEGLPKWIGDDYKEHLTLTKDLGFDD